MSPLAFGAVVFACVLGGGLLGTFLRVALPERHLGAESKDLVRLTMGLLATMSALVVGLLITTAKTAYDTQGGEFRCMSAEIVLLDRALAHYGPEAVLATVLVCALSMAAAVFLILELDQPFDGLIRLSSEPLRGALRQLGR